MQLVYEDKGKRKTKNKEEITFSSFSSYHLIVLTARAKGKQQLAKSATDDEDLTIQIGNKLSIPKRIPTVDDPKWTGDFNDDPDQIILARAIFGEVRDWLYPDKARIAVGWSIRNRVEDSRWPNT